MLLYIILVLEEVNPLQLRGNNKSDKVIKKKGISLFKLKSAINGPLSLKGNLLVIISNFQLKDFFKELIRLSYINIIIEFKNITIKDAI